jgi:Mg-chelatase subunit ChlD
MALATASASTLRLGPVFTEPPPQIDVVLEAPAVQELPAAESLTLVDEQGRPAGVAQTVLPFRESGHRMAVVVAVDVSGSMAGAPLDEIKEALRALAASRGPQEEIALVSFADDVVVESRFGASPSELGAAIDRLAPRGRITELFKGLFKALALLAEQPGARQRLLVVSDGRDEGEAYQLDDVIERARSLQIPVDAVGLSRIDPRYLSTLERLADLTGGRYAPAESGKDLERLVGSGIERLRQTPVARFANPNLPRDGTRHRLGVRWTRGGEVLDAETIVVLPPLPDGKTPKREDPVPPESVTDRLKSLPFLLAAGGLLLLLGLAAWWLSRSRRARARIPPASQQAPRVEPPRIQPPAGSPPPASVATFASRPGPEPPPATVPSSPDAAPAPAQRRATRFRQGFAAPAAGSPGAILLGESGSLAGVRVPVDRDPFWIGAEEENDLKIPEDAYLSGRHACLSFREGTLIIEDRQSTNGTFINGDRLDTAPRPLSPGDRVRVGRTDLVVLVP